VSEFSVGEFTEFSDHAPVHFALNTNAEPN
jgi:hypothetical protein